MKKSGVQILSSCIKNKLSLKALFTGGTKKFGAIDLGFTRSKFTRAKGRWGNSAVKRRLHRGRSSISWRLAFPNASIAHLGAISSYHALILLETNPKDTFAHRPFKFEAMWIRDDRCAAMIEKAWNEEVRGSDFVKLYKKTSCH